MHVKGSSGRRLTWKAERARAQWAAGLLLVFIIGGATAALAFAWSSTASDRPEFWAIAAPGIATGAGTIVLALVTVWASWTARIDREEERQQAEEQEAARDARKVIMLLHHRPAGATVTIANAGREPILNVTVYGARTTPQENGYVYQWMADTIDDAWPGQWFEHSQRVLFLKPGDHFSIEGNIYRTDADGYTSNAEAGDGKRLEDKLEVRWTDSTGRHWHRIGQADPVRTAEPPPSIADWLALDPA